MSSPAGRVADPPTSPMTLSTPHPAGRRPRAAPTCRSTRSSTRPVLVLMSRAVTADHPFALVARASRAGRSRDVSRRWSAGFRAPL